MVRPNRRAISYFAFGVSALVTACGVETPPTHRVTFEELKASAFEEKPGRFVIEGDLRFSEEGLRDYYETQLLPEMEAAELDENGFGRSFSPLTVAQRPTTVPGYWTTVRECPPAPPCGQVWVCTFSGCRWETRCPPAPPCVDVPVWIPPATVYVDDVWSPSQTTLTYCIANTEILANGTSIALTAARKTRLVNTMNTARMYWNNASVAKINYVPAQDASCNASNTNVTFNVQVVNSSAYLAAAFFPSDARADRQLDIDATHLTTASIADVVSTLSHELGHALGFRHEHIRAFQVNPSCIEFGGNYRNVTGYDGNSIMHYNFCMSALSNALTTLTGSDVGGVRSIYGNASAPQVSFVGLAGKCLDVQGGNSANGTGLQLWDCNNTAAQKWTVEPTGEIKILGKCMDLNGNNNADGTRIQIFDCNSTAAQRWVAVGNTIVHRESLKCVDVTGGNSATGTPLRLLTCNGTAAQTWNIQ